MFRLLNYFINLDYVIFKTLVLKNYQANGSVDITTLVQVFRRNKSFIKQFTEFN